MEVILPENSKTQKCVLHMQMWIMALHYTSVIIKACRECSSVMQEFSILLYHTSQIDYKFEWIPFEN